MHVHSEDHSGQGKAFLSVRGAASMLGVSESWIRRHIAELPAVPVGRLIRFDAVLFARQFEGKTVAGNRMEQKGETPMFHAAVKTRYQEGRVYRRGKRKVKWYGKFREDQIGADGKLFRVQKNISLGTLAELPDKRAAKRELARRMGTGTPVRADTLFSDLVSRWRAAVVPTLKSATAIYYQKMLTTHVLPAFGQRGAKSISRVDVELFLAGKAQRYCRASIRGMRVSLGRVLTWAVACGWLDKNPCAGVKLPQAPTKVRRTILCPEQITGLASKVEEPYSTLVLFLAATGLRISEAVGVQKSDFEGNVLKLRRRFFQSDNGGELGELKTKNSARDLPLSGWLADRVKALAVGEGFCFCSRTGTPINQKNALRRYIHPACKGLGFRIGGWHDFRHTLTTWALKKYPTKVVSEMLGHASVKTTLDVYSHVLHGDFVEPLAEIAGKLVPDGAKIAETQVAA